MTELIAPDCSDEPIWRVWMSAFHAPTLAIADELGLFGALEHAPATAAELAIRLGIEARATEAIAALMTALGFLSHADGRFALASPGRTYLLPQGPYYWGGMLKRMRDNPVDCNKLVDALRRGKAADEARLTGMWQAPKPPDAALVAFTHAMHAHSFALAMSTIARFELGGATRVLDVAGGSGSYSIAAALRHRDLPCTVLDLAAVCGVAASYAQQHGVADRVSVVAADMFVDPWPSGCDRVLLSDIFHDWDDERCRLLAERAYAALPPGGRILVHEMLLDDDGLGPEAALSYSMIMVFVAQGRQRSARELTAILAGAGFRNVTVTATANGYAVVAGDKLS
jgi:hypothetical protein